MLTATEFEVVEQTHYPAIMALPKEDLSNILKLLRDYRNKARDRSRQQRREMRGKSPPRAAVAVGDNSGTERKGEIFASALKRVNRELSRIKKQESQKIQGAHARRALELKRRYRVRHHPSTTRNANGPMTVIENPNATVTVDPREIGRMSQFIKVAQARRDSR
ncbi:hypothetical protein N825_22740 [Skermanella stibiiresistens SB22]|uniref:Uncharacterized protein n=2 Tax=Skermanella TaxID=204447 RepID=W9GWV2_9PROT|nr:hypothetical protein N825_22740 [Skermanella stibiiresistens SB22]